MGSRDTDFAAKCKQKEEKRGALEKAKLKAEMEKKVSYLFHTFKRIFHTKPSYSGETSFGISYLNSFKLRNGSF